MELFFVTSNKNKFVEIQNIISNLEQIEIDLAEIQDSNAHNVIRAKLKEALSHHSGQFIVEDTSLYFDCLNGLPGPLIKFFLERLGNEGLANLVEKMGNNKAEARTIIGYAKNADEVYFFEGSIKGTIVKPSGKTGFGWDPIFKPDGFDKTFAQMSQDEKNNISMRKEAALKLRDFLE